MLPRNWGRGIALAESFKSIVCQVVDVEVVGKDIKVRRVVSAVDCGTALHPENVKAQIASAAIFGLTAALKGKITLSEGVVQQSNFNDYPLLSMAECPQLRRSSSTAVPARRHRRSGHTAGGTSAGERDFAATGKRLRGCRLGWVDVLQTKLWKLMDFSESSLRICLNSPRNGDAVSSSAGLTPPDFDRGGSTR